MIPNKPLPRSFITDGYILASEACRKAPDGSVRRFRRLMLGTDGESDSGKTEFAMGAPEPIIVVALDRSFDGIIDNPKPPPTRRTQIGFKVIMAPTASQANQKVYQEYWANFYIELMKALANPDARTVVIDGDSDSYELQLLAEYGKLLQIPQLARHSAYAARRALINRAHDSGKIIIGTNKVKAEFKTVRNPDGTPVVDPETKRELSVRTGKMKGEGFPFRDYLWQIWVRHKYRKPRVTPTGKAVGPEWGIEITKCKPNKELEGTELWGSDCNLETLLQVVYPDVPLADWGY